ncbi:LLM class flavin-dependent oxidoreductase [soil metagenome]
MQLGVYSFGSTARDPETGVVDSTAAAMRNLLEAIRLADEVGLEYFGIGEHHTPEMPASAAATVLGGAATVTKRIRLGSAVTVLSTDDPVRVYQQFATLDAISNGRAEITAGRGSSTESFPLFGFSLSDYDRLYAEKLELLLAIDAGNPVTWSGSTRAGLDEAIIVPRPDRGSLPIWLGTGGNPGSSIRAGRAGLPISYGIIGGQPARFGQLADLYRRSAEEADVPSENVRVSVATPAFIGDDGARARDLWWIEWQRMMTEVGGQRGFAPPSRSGYDRDSAPGGALFVGQPEEIAERIIELHRHMGHMRQFFQMDIGHLPQRDFLHAIELLGTVVKPLVEAELGAEPDSVPA